MSISENATEYEAIQNLSIDEFYYLVASKWKKNGGKTKEQEIDDWLWD